MSRIKHQLFHQSIESCDDHPDNPRHQSGFDPGRRQFVVSSLALALAGCFGRVNCSQSPSFGFGCVAVQSDPFFDSVTVPYGYTAKPLLSWGDQVMPGAPAWHDDASNSWQEQLLQAGQNHDGMHFFPFPEAPNHSGLLVLNHEYINPTLHPNGFTETTDAAGRRQRPLEEVRKEQAAHGLSIIELRRDGLGQWQTRPGRYSRRITALTPMQISGPAAGHPGMMTEDDPSGLEVLGTINNCAMGFTPWGTYLTCEENWKHYFVNRNAGDYDQRTSHYRYGVTQGQSSQYFAWESVDERFNATPLNGRPHQGFVNEPSRFGWVVEIDPFDPDSTPVKRTAMGRLIRECATLSIADNGTMAFYSGDDTRGEYIYKFVPESRWNGGDASQNRDTLDHGTLYVARFNDDGSGEWLPLVHDENGLNAGNGFADQATVLINARAAADHMGATTMDRPEWVACHRGHPWVYAALTKNMERGSDEDQPVNAANPRAMNRYGHIIRWREANEDPAATHFEWELFALAGETSRNFQNEPVDTFACPDTLAFGPNGKLWIGTDFNDESANYQAMGTNQLLCADPDTGDIQRFLVGPWGAEITGATFSPDGTTMWVNVQHPGGHYPGNSGERPRSTTLTIQKNDGGMIGS
ncbi:MAG: PhoX family protein [Pseudomonadota bacterium]